MRRRCSSPSPSRSSLFWPRAMNGHPAYGRERLDDQRGADRLHQAHRIHRAAAEAPYAAGSGRPRRPSSAIVRQTSWLYPSGEPRSGGGSRTHSRARQSARSRRRAAVVLRWDRVHRRSESERMPGDDIALISFEPHDRRLAHIAVARRQRLQEVVVRAHRCRPGRPGPLRERAAGFQHQLGQRRWISVPLIEHETRRRDARRVAGRENGGW